jgi:hypothetical protein
MKLAQVLNGKGDKIIDKWVTFTLKTYQSSGFFIKERDAFANPVGGQVRSILTQLLPLLLEGQGKDSYRLPLKHLMRIRAVQDFTPSQAIAPLNAVKHIVRESLGGAQRARELESELYDFEFAVDLAVLSAFDLYTECRHQLHEIRVAELKTGTSILTDSPCPSKKLQAVEKISE